MKKKLTLILSLVLLISIFQVSFAIDANVNYKVYQNYTSTTSNFYIGKYRADMIYQILTNYSSNTSNENYVTAFDSLIAEVENLGYKYVVYWDPDNSKYYLVINNLNTPNVEFVRFRQRITLMKTDNTEDTVLGYYLGPNLGYDARNFVITSDSQVSSLVGFQGVSSYVLRSNVDIYDMTKISDYYCYWDGSSIYYEAPEIPDSIVMENPFTNIELISIHERLNNSSVLKDYLPSNYNSYFITYNKNTGQYKAFFYPDSLLPYLKVYPENFVFDNGDFYDYKTYSIYFGTEYSYKHNNWSAYLNMADNSEIYMFVTFGDTADFWHFDTKSWKVLKETLFGFENQPIIFSTKEFNMYFTGENGDIVFDSDSNAITSSVSNIGKTDLTDDETGGDLSTDVSIGEKDDESIWTAITNIPQKIIDGIKDLFSPDLSLYDRLSNLLKEKMPIIEESKAVIDTTLSILSEEVTEPPQIKIDLSLATSDIDYGTEAVALDFSWYKPYKQTVDMVIVGFVYILFFWRLFYRIPSILAGSDSFFSLFTSDVSSTGKGGKVK